MLDQRPHGRFDALMGDERFDRPKTIALKSGRDGVVTEWHPTFAGVALDLGIGVCWPYRPQERHRESGRLGEGLVLQTAPISSDSCASGWSELGCSVGYSKTDRSRLRSSLAR